MDIAIIEKRNNWGREARVEYLNSRCHLVSVCVSGSGPCCGVIVSFTTVVFTLLYCVPELRKRMSSPVVNSAEQPHATSTGLAGQHPSR